MSVFSRISAITLLGASIALATPATANLIVNGGFEQPDVASGTWEVFSASEVNGWEGSNIEIWDNYEGISAQEGDQFAELNAHPSSGSVFGIFQDFATTAGTWYDVSFAYRARQSDTESFSADVAGESWIVDDHTTGDWSLFSGSFLATADTSSLRFTTIVPESGTVGNFLDNVVVTASVPEPTTVALLGLGLLGLGLRRRK